MRMRAPGILRPATQFQSPGIVKVPKAGHFTKEEAVGVLLCRYGNPGPMSAIIYDAFYKSESGVDTAKSCRFVGGWGV